MGTPGFVQILLVVLLIVVLFGRGKISSLMGDMAQGIKAFKKGMNDDDADQKQSQDLKAPNVITSRQAEDTRAETVQQPSHDKV